MFIKLLKMLTLIKFVRCWPGSYTTLDQHSIINEKWSIELIDHQQHRIALKVSLHGVNKFTTCLKGIIPTSESGTNVSEFQQKKEKN